MDNIDSLRFNIDFDAKGAVQGAQITTGAMQKIVRVADQMTTAFESNAKSFVEQQVKKKKR